VASHPVCDADIYSSQAKRGGTPHAWNTDVKPTIVLVHGAFADASSWNGVIERR
jgi:hypothetical protein